MELKERSQMDPARQWHLNDILNGNAEFEALYAKTQKMIKAFAVYEGKVKDAPKEAVRAYFDMCYPIEKLYVYAHMHKDEDGTCDEALQQFQKSTQLYADANAAGSFMRPELLAMPAEQLLALAEDPEMTDYSVFLKDLLRYQPHSLNTDTEKLMARAGEVMQGTGEAFSALNDVDLPLPMVTNDQGEKVQLTHGLYGTLIRSRNPEVRKEAFLGLSGAYQKFGSTLTALYTANVKADRFDARARNYESCLSASLFPDEVPVSVYDSLIESVHAAIPALNKYMEIRRKKLGLDELHLWDLYVSVTDGFDMKLSYDEAYDTVMKGLAPLGEDYAADLKEARENGWVDVYENKNKHAGAYSWGVWGSHPYVLLNHTDDLYGMMTLAHELGHAMHTKRSNAAQPFPKAGYSLFVAEVASTCNEMLMMRYLLKAYKDDPAAKEYLLVQLAEEFRTTVFRQTMFAEFEKKAHAMLEAGTPLTETALSDMYYELNRQYYGGGCIVDEAVRSEWMRIPHFYNSFYVYKYATGFSCAAALSDRILTLGESAVTDYKRFLSAGCSLPPIEVLKLAGVDISKPQTVQSALKVFTDTINELADCL